MPAVTPKNPKRAARASNALDPRVNVQRVLATVDSIPRGRVASYGGVADEAGLARRARFVGRVMRELPSGTSLPWHRVVSSTGAFGLRGAAAREQRRRLAAESVTFDARGRVKREHFVFVARRREG